MAGRDLRLVRGRPLVLRAGGPKGNIVTNQLVYEVHEVRQLRVCLCCVCTVPLSEGRKATSLLISWCMRSMR